MTSILAFRLLIILEVVFTLSGAVVYHFLSDSLPPALQEYLSETDEGIFSGMDTEAASYWLFLVVVVFVWAAVSVALFCFWRPARAIYVLLTLVSIGFYPFSGPTVETALESTCYYMSALCAGGVLVLMYWSPVKERFEIRTDLATSPKS